MPEPPPSDRQASALSPKELEELYTQHSCLSSKELGCTNLGEFDFETLSEEPVYIRPFWLNPKKAQKVEALRRDFEKQGFIEPARSDYSSPEFVIPKKDGSNRLVIDYRALNKRTKIAPPPCCQRSSDRFIERIQQPAVGVCE
ncbi:hypothetical protein FOZ63_028788 [Perkinsus olseni]|uniref:Uncharacterized protein n=1 Tax=Perkinsus olseni TaxID=32597 RepID=A0A7J6RDJ2_PEROL|nr:hypothetical protein FOZ60_016019 [Perkinsus olseni]KAF4718818.1 hypothetical protein FOZ63_028788 [Perkinsus olseni]KAF4755921.1 hypothetical protein FOZ62_027569 [Perkinsus olseni]